MRIAENWKDYKIKQTVKKEFNEYEWLNSFPAQLYSASGGGGIQGRISLGGQTDSFLQ